MERTTIALPEELLEHLRLLAAERHTSMAALIREALEEKVFSHRSQPRSLGIGDSGDTNTARRTIEERTEPPNANAGLGELRWLLQNKHRLSRDFGGLWVAVLYEGIVASGSSFDEVYRDLCARGVRDALIEHIPDDPNQWDRLVA